MAIVGIRDLQRHMGRLLRRVREDKETIEVTHRGRVVARIVPVDQPGVDEDDAVVWTDIDRLADEIGARWTAGVSAADAVAEGRRAL